MDPIYFESSQLVLVADLSYAEFIEKNQIFDEIHRNKLQIIDFSLVFCARKA